MSPDTMEVIVNGRIERREIEYRPVAVVLNYGLGSERQVYDLPRPVHGDDELVIQTVDGKTHIIRN